MTPFGQERRVISRILDPPHPGSVRGVQPLPVWCSALSQGIALNASYRCRCGRFALPDFGRRRANGSRRWSPTSFVVVYCGFSACPWLSLFCWRSSRTCSDCGTGCRRWPVFPSGRRIASSAPVEPLGWIARIAYATGQPCENRRSTCLTPVAAAMREGDCTLASPHRLQLQDRLPQWLSPMVAPFRGSAARLRPLPDSST